MGKLQERKGLPDDVDQLIESVAWKLVGKYGFTEDDREDIEQDLRLHFLQNRPKFNHRRGKLVAFATCIIRSKVATIIEHRKAKMRDYHRWPLSLDATRDTDGTPVMAMEDDDGDRRLGLDRTHFTDNVDLAIDVAGALADKPEELRDFCQRHSSASITEIHHETGISRGTLYDRKAKVKQIFIEAGLEQYLASSSGASRRRPVDDSQEHGDD